MSGGLLHPGYAEAGRAAESRAQSMASSGLRQQEGHVTRCNYHNAWWHSGNTAVAVHGVTRFQRFRRDTAESMKRVLRRRVFPLRELSIGARTDSETVRASRQGGRKADFQSAAGYQPAPHSGSANGAGICK